MSDEERISQFIEISGATRRAAAYFLGINRQNVENALGSFFDLGEGSIPEDYREPNPPSVEVTRNNSTESISEGSSVRVTTSPQSSRPSTPIASSSSPSPPPPPPPPPIKTTGSQKTTSSNEVTPVDDDYLSFPKRPNISRLNEVMVEFDEEQEKKQEKVITPAIPRRIVEGKKEVLIIWKNGYSNGSVFSHLEGEEYLKMIKTIKSGKLPKIITQTEEVLLINKRNTEYTQSDEENILKIA